MRTKNATCYEAADAVRPYLVDEQGFVDSRLTFFKDPVTVEFRENAPHSKKNKEVVCRVLVEGVKFYEFKFGSIDVLKSRLEENVFNIMLVRGLVEDHFHEPLTALGFERSAKGKKHVLTYSRWDDDRKMEQVNVHFNRLHEGCFKCSIDLFSKDSFGRGHAVSADKYTVPLSDPDCIKKTLDSIKACLASL